VIKRLLDITLSLLALVCCAPIMLIVAIAILASDGRPILFRSKRIGQFGRPFHMIKFRSMVVNAENLGSGSIPRMDSRVTRLGRLLRAAKIDELPQFLNVLAGQMSLVGPRPELCRYLKTFDGRFARILNLRPGLTDWATLVNIDEGSLLEGISDPDAGYENHIRPFKAELQLKYAESATLFTDFRILAYTAIKLVFRNWIPAELRGYRESLVLAVSGD
jgi:lipopolysaccharide/colanic/teichoic acid biosynthesis glycosyltransferase